MATGLVLPDGYRPTNLHLSEDVGYAMVDSDMFDICNRIKEIDPRLYIVNLAKGDKFVYAIMEGQCLDGQDHLIFKVKQLDARVLNKLRELMGIPFQARYAKLKAEEYKFDADEHERELDELYETLGRPMWTELEKSGFIQRPVSYPKQRVKAKVAAIS